MTLSATPRPIQAAAARLLLDPAAAHAATAQRRLICWAILKSARGQHVHQARLQDLACGRLAQGSIAAPLRAAPDPAAPAATGTRS